MARPQGQRVSQLRARGYLRVRVFSAAMVAANCVGRAVVLTTLARLKSLDQASSKRMPCSANQRPVTAACARPCAFKGTSR